MPIGFRETNLAMTYSTKFVWSPLSFIFFSHSFLLSSNFFRWFAVEILAPNCTCSAWAILHRPSSDGSTFVVVLSLCSYSNDSLVIVECLFEMYEYSFTFILYVQVRSDILRMPVAIVTVVTIVTEFVAMELVIMDSLLICCHDNKWASCYGMRNSFLWSPVSSLLWTAVSEIRLHRDCIVHFHCCRFVITLFFLIAERKSYILEL